MGVAPDGRTREWKFLRFSPRGRRHNLDLAAAAEATLKGISLRPPEVDGGAASDFVYVAIPVRQGP